MLRSADVTRPGARRETGRPIHRSIGKIDRLVVFDAVMKAGSLTGAAKVLGVTQPAVSRHISLLEDELQTSLFQRGSSRVTPTASAQALAHRVDAGLAEFEVGLAEVRGRADVLTLAVQPAIAESWIAPRLGALRTAIEPAVLQLVIYERDDELHALGHDLSIRFGTDFGRFSDKLISEAVMPVAAPDYAIEHELTVRSLAPELASGPRLLHLDSIERHWLDWREWFESVGHAYDSDGVEIVHPNYGILIQQALAGQGVVLGWHKLLGDLVTRGLLVPVGPTVRRQDFGYHLVWPASLDRHVGLRRLRVWLAATVAELVDVP